MYFPTLVQANNTQIIELRYWPFRHGIQRKSFDLMVKLLLASLPHAYYAFIKSWLTNSRSLFPKSSEIGQKSHWNCLFSRSVVKTLYPLSISFIGSTQVRIALANSGHDSFEKLMLICVYGYSETQNSHKIARPWGHLWHSSLWDSSWTKRIKGLVEKNVV